MLYNCNGEFKVYEGDSWKKEHLPLQPIEGFLYPEYKFSSYKYFDDFTYNGKQYNLNSVVKLSDAAKRFLGADDTYTRLVQHEITNTNKERWGYVARRSSEKVWHVFTTVPPDQLIEEVTTPACARKENKKVEYYKDNQVKGMAQMWAYYILFMVVATIFNDRIMIWVIISCLFFGVRGQKLRKTPHNNYEIK